MPIRLDHRGLLLVKGTDASVFLDNLLTCQASTLGDGEAVQAALLKPQGKILFEALVFRLSETEYWLDTDREALPDFLQRLQLYKLRANVEVSAVRDAFGCYWAPLKEDCPAEDLNALVKDPRGEGLGWRMIKKVGPEVQPSKGNLADYHIARIQALAAEFGLDYMSDQRFPAELNMDLTGAVDFQKGCFVGQEVVSRMHRRGAQRKRICKVTLYDSQLFTAQDSAVTVNGKAIGQILSRQANQALALIRLDRLDEAQMKQEKLRIDDDPARKPLIFLPEEIRFEEKGGVDG